MSVDMAALNIYWATGARVLAVLVLSYIVVRLGDSLISRVFERAAKARGPDHGDSRARTLSGLLRSALRYGVGAVALFTVLDLAGIDTKALLGGAAVLGLAVGFGAQNLVRDIITGFFIIYERQYDVGEYVSAAGVSGIVEEIGLRTTRLRDWNGEVHVIPNGLIDKTTNSSRAGSRALIEVSIAYEEDPRKAMEVIQETCDQIAREFPVIVDGPRVLGVSRLESSGVVLSVWARTQPLEQWAIERQMRLRVLEALKKAGIEIPYQRVVVIDRESGGHPPDPRDGS